MPSSKMRPRMHDPVFDRLVSELPYRLERSKIGEQVRNLVRESLGYEEKYNPFYYGNARISYSIGGLKELYDEEDSDS